MTLLVLSNQQANLILYTANNINIGVKWFTLSYSDNYPDVVFWASWNNNHSCSCFVSAGQIWLYSMGFWNLKIKYNYPLLGMIWVQQFLKTKCYKFSELFWRYYGYLCIFIIHMHKTIHKGCWYTSFFTWHVIWYLDR